MHRSAASRRDRTPSGPVLVTALLTLALLLLGGAGPAGAAKSARADTWEWPLDPRPDVVRGFEPPADPWGPGHRGVDLAGRPGQAVLAVAPGAVSFAGSIAGVGIVVVQHGSVRSTYQPVEAAVRVGDRVDSGTRIGTLATPGSHCLPAACLHLGARRGDAYLDPLSLLADGPVRLKPWEGLPGDAAPMPGIAATTTLRLSPSSGARVGLTIGST